MKATRSRPQNGDYRPAPTGYHAAPSASGGLGVDDRTELRSNRRHMIPRLKLDRGACATFAGYRIRSPSTSNRLAPVISNPTSVTSPMARSTSPLHFKVIGPSAPARCNTVSPPRCSASVTWPWSVAVFEPAFTTCSRSGRRPKVTGLSGASRWDWPQQFTICPASAERTDRRATAPKPAREKG